MSEPQPIFGRIQLLAQMFGGPAVVWLAVAAVTLLGFGCILRWLPDRAVRAALWLPARLLYRVRVFGREHVPTCGPVLLVCNQVSYVDAFLVLLAQRRPVRFVIWARPGEIKKLGWLLKLAGVIAIDSSCGPRGVIRSLRAARQALKDGQAVCIFAEGAVTRTGFVLHFHRLFEHVLKRSPAAVVPISVDHVWGSLFGHRGKFFWKPPQVLPYPVTVAFGPPLPATARPVQVRLAIQKLSADSAVARGDERLPVHRQFVRIAARHPFRPCLIDPTNQGRVWRYGEVLAAAAILSRLLRPRLGDDRMVGLWLPPSVGGAFANIALALLGKTAVNLNYTSSAEGIRSSIRQCGICHVLTARLFTSKVNLDAGPEVELIYLEDFRKEVTRGQRIKTLLAIAFLPAVVLDRWVLGLSRHRPDDLAAVIFSSGSTGDPKGVMLSQRNIAANSESMIQAIDPRPSDRILGILPFFHSFGYTVTLWLPLLVGASVVFHADPRQAREIGELCRKYRSTLFLATPTFLRFCLKRCEPGDFDTLRILIVGAEKLAAALAQQFQEKFGVLPLEGYGCTELSPVAAANVPDWEQGGAHLIGNKPGTIGRMIPGIAAKIVRPETFESAPPGEDGLLLVYGANVMVGYLGRPEATRDVVRDGWYVTGDIAHFDEDGFIQITDRLARFSKIGGEMVPHQKVEDELHSILATEDRVCVVTAVADERRGERLVVLHTSLNCMEVPQLWVALNNRGLPNLWVPGERDFFQVPELPVLGTGKMDLKRVKELAVELTGAVKGTAV